MKVTVKWGLLEESDFKLQLLKESVHQRYQKVNKKGNCWCAGESTRCGRDARSDFGMDRVLTSEQYLGEVLVSR